MFDCFITNLTLIPVCTYTNTNTQTQVPAKGAVRSVESDAADASTTVVLGSENFLSLLTSSIVCVLKSEPQVIDHLLSWGFTNSLCDLLKRAVSTGRIGSPVTSIMRLLHQLVSRVDCVDSLASSPTDLVQQAVLALGGSGDANTPDQEKVVLPKEAAFFCELLKKIFQTRLSSFLGHWAR